MQCQLWMGSLKPNMTESFIMTAFNRMGSRPLGVKVMRNKFTGEPAGYAFVNFLTDRESIETMHKLNGKPIPGSCPVVRFRLNTATREAGNTQYDREFSIWVGDLSPEVDDYSLYQVFAAKYTSIRAAKVILDSSGFTKSYGFVRFGSEEEQRNALSTMNGYVGLGSKALKICPAVPKPKGPYPYYMHHYNDYYNNGYNSGVEYNQYYDPSGYWQGYAPWAEQQYGAYESFPPPPPAPAAYATDVAQALLPSSRSDDMEIVEYKRTIDTNKMNEEFLDPELSLWDSLEASQWFPQKIVDE